MASINQIVNLDLHPINQSEKYLNVCKNKLRKESVLQLNNFLSSKSLNDIQKEANDLHSKAFYCSQNHTILLTKKNINISKDDPCNIEVKSNKGCVPHDLIPSNSNLRTLYNSNDFIRFIEEILDLKKFIPMLTLYHQLIIIIMKKTNS